jgi:glycerol-3-phosphate dehydrogenase subunit B
MKTDVVVIGAGLAGLTAGWQAAAAGRRVRVVSKGWGATHWGSGCIGVLGMLEGEMVTAPPAGLPRLLAAHPDHPYRMASEDVMQAALTALQGLTAAAGYPLQGELGRNWLLPSAVGAVRPVCLAPETMVAGDLSLRAPMVIVGFDACLDFYPELVADNLEAQGWPARSVLLVLPELERRRVRNSGIVARLFEDAAFVAQVVEQLKPQLGDAQRVGFPALLGRDHAMTVKAQLEAALERPVFEIPILPPSIPGMRLQRILVQAIEQAGGEVLPGLEVVAFEAEGKRITAVATEAAARKKWHAADEFVLATGGILGGGVVTEYEDRVTETVFGLPLAAPTAREAWFRPEFLDARGHPIFRSGVQVDAAYRPLAAGAVVYENLRAVGHALAGVDGVRERSVEGVALVSGYQVGQALGQS